jgi:hypothetical protein
MKRSEFDQSSFQGIHRHLQSIVGFLIRSLRPLVAALLNCISDSAVTNFLFASFGIATIFTPLSRTRTKTNGAFTKFAATNVARVYRHGNCGSDDWLFEVIQRRMDLFRCAAILED